MDFPKNNIIDNWLEENPNPEAAKMVEKNLAVVAKVSAILEEKNLSQKNLAEILGKRPSEVSKWLTGLHNLTLKSITKMEVAVDTDLINIAPEKEYK